MTRATFEPIDAAIPDDFDRWQDYPDDVRFKPYLRTFLTDPVYWKRHVPSNLTFAFTWQEYKYSEVTTPAAIDAQLSSEAPGIYMFYARPDNVINGFPRFTFYIGISNEHDSERPLKHRLKDYLPETIRAKKKRDNIDQMLQLYYGVLWVAYAFVDWPSSQLSELEMKLHGFIFPCYARRDYPADIKTQIKRFGVPT